MAGQVCSISILAKYWNINESGTVSDISDSGTLFRSEFRITVRSGTQEQCQEFRNSGTMFGIRNGRGYVSISCVRTSSELDIFFNVHYPYQPMSSMSSVHIYHFQYQPLPISKLITKCCQQQILDSSNCFRC